ncbi:MAG: gliding motility-associated C-terminal domain-containing protein [Bacteroidales bacterium]|nr:gliding motility-associated C-terminal domain-containing protein [Bacteroidales bacterium]
MFTFFFSFPFSGKAQDIAIGTSSTTSNSLPFSSANWYNYSQQIYYQNEINQIGKICSISFFYASSENINRMLSVYIGHTNKSFFAFNFDWVPASQLNLVYYGTVNFTDSNWVTIYFDTPFEYNNTQNLVIAIDDNSGFTNILGGNFQNHNKLNERSLTVSSNTNQTIQSPSPGIKSTNRNNIVFHFCNPTPMTNTTLNSCDLLYSDPGGLNNYTNNVEYTQTIHSDPLESGVLNMHFLEFALNTGDSLWVYNGTNIYSSLIGCYTETNAPPTLTASTHSLTFRFKSDGSDSNTGWLAQIRCQPCTFTPTSYESPCLSDSTTVTGFSAIPFCTDSDTNGVSFPSTVGGSAFNGQIGCLSQTPNPTWYFMKIHDPGDLLIKIHQVDNNNNPADVDFACWGPFYGENHIDFLRRFCCGESELYIEPTTFHIPNSSLGDHTNDMGGYPVNNLIDCSNFGGATEYCFIPNAQPNAYYLLLLINKDGLPGTISFGTVQDYTQATTDCSLIALASNNGPVCEGETIYLHSNFAPSNATFVWSGPNGFFSTLQHPIILNATEENSGSYSVIISANNQVSAPATTYVVVHPYPEITFNPSTPYICEGDSLSVSAFGALNYYWPSLLDSGETQLISAPIPTSYTVIGESNGCATTASFLLDVKQHPTTNIILPSASTILNDSIINVYAITNGGTPDYYFEWTGTNVIPDNNDSISVPIDSTDCNSILHFSLTVFDTYGCRATDHDSIVVYDTIAPIFVSTPFPFQLAEINGSQFQIPDLTNLMYSNISDNIWDIDILTITQSPVAGTIITNNDTVTITIIDPCGNSSTISIPIIIPLSSQITLISPVICNGSNTGMAVVQGYGGVQPYSYYWNTSPVQNNDTVFNLTAGTYYVTITDFLNQTIIDTLILNQPPTFTLSITGITNVCIGDSSAGITIHALGGMLPYEYEWNITSNDSTLTNLPAGYYTVTVTDAQGCWDSTSVTISNYDQPTISLTPNGNNVCPNFGMVTTTSTITGGLAPYFTFWDCHGSIIQNMPQLSILIDSTNCNYIDTMKFQVMDAHGCIARDSVFIHVIDTTNPIFTTLPIPIQYATFNNPNYQIPDFGNLIQNNISDNCWIPSRITITQNPFANTIINSNTYVTITITDPCGNSKSTWIRVILPLRASITDTNHVACYGTNTGSATVTAYGGISPYTYHWSTIPSQTTSTATNLLAGNYTVTVTDSLGVSVTTSILITQPTNLSTSISGTNVLCNGGATGSATLTVSGGTTPYQFLWNGGATSQNRTNIVAGSYTVTVTDNRGCTKTNSVSITQPTAINPLTFSHNASCNGNNGVLTISSTGGVAPYQYQWSNTVQNDTISGLAPGIYTCTVTDGNNCTKTISDTIFETPTMTIDQMITNPETCTHMNGSIEVVVSGGSAPYQYAWSFGTSQNSILDQLPAGTYSVTVTDQDGCTQTEEATIENMIIQLSVASTTSSSCGQNNGTVTIDVVSDFVDYTFDWGPIVTFNDNSASNLAPGDYNVIVYSGDCSVNLDFTIGEIPGPKACFDIVFPFGNGMNIPITFENCSQNSDNWYWSFGDLGTSNIEDPTHNYNQEGEYVVTLVANNEFGCNDTVAQIVSIIGDTDIFIPNSFTPNEDGLNDVFIPIMREINKTGYNFKIYNRFGQLVFESFNIEQGWDGKVNGIPIEMSSIFTYVIKYEYLNGRKMLKKGSVSLIK